MVIHAIRDMLDQEPFAPFRVHTSDGRSYEVRNPEMVVPLKSTVFIALPDTERFAVVSYLHIAALEKMTNGTHRKPKRRR